MGGDERRRPEKSADPSVDNNTKSVEGLKTLDLNRPIEKQLTLKH